MGYTKKWTPLVEPYPNSLPSLVGTFQEIHTNLLESNWIWEDVPGQIASFDAITVLPPLNSVIGFRIYRLNDGHDDLGMIYMKVTFCRLYGALTVKSYTFNIPACRVSISDSLDFTPSRTHSTSVAPYSYVTSYTGSPAAFIKPGLSIISQNSELGFYGYVHNSNSSKDLYNTSPSFTTFSCIIQRNFDADYNLIPGFMSYGMVNTVGSVSVSDGAIETSNLWRARQIGPSYTSDELIGASPRIFLSATPSTVGGTQLFPVYNITPKFNQVKTLACYEKSQIAEGDTFPVNIGSKTITMIALGESHVYNNGLRLAMIYE